MKKETVQADVGRVSYRTKDGRVITPVAVLDNYFVAWNHEIEEPMIFMLSIPVDPVDLLPVSYGLIIERYFRAACARHQDKPWIRYETAPIPADSEGRLVRYEKMVEDLR